MNAIMYRTAFTFALILSALTYSQAQVWKKIIPEKEPAPLITDENAAAVLKQLQDDVYALASSKMEGRLTGTHGEAMAGMYIEKRMADIGLTPLGTDRSFRKAFRLVAGRQLTPETRFNIGNKLVSVTEEAFPAPFSAPATEESYMLPDSREPNGPWLISLYDDAQQAANASFNWKTQAYELASYAQERGATSVMLYDAFGAKNEPVFSAVADMPPLDIPVMVLNKKGYDAYVKPMKVIQPVYLKIAYRNEYKQGTNIVGYLNNNAALTVVVGAHYDHIGVGEGKQHMPGADDNASGVAAMLALAQKIKNSGFKKYNYVFVAFSGNEQGLAGSKAFLNDKTLLPADKIAYMLNLDMVGRLKATRTIYVDGTVTSSSWSRAFRALGASLKISKDMTDIGPSDHYNYFDARIPVLSVSTGGHPDEHTKNDIIGKLNMEGIKTIANYLRGLTAYLETQPRPLFITDAEDLADAPGSDGVTVQPGLLPDYDYREVGVLLGGLVEGKAASKAGLQVGDIIMMVGGKRVGTIEDYLNILKTLNPGNKVVFKVKRGPTVQDFTLAL